MTVKGALLWTAKHVAFWLAVYYGFYEGHNVIADLYIAFVGFGCFGMVMAGADVPGIVALRKTGMHRDVRYFIGMLSFGLQAFAVVWQDAWITAVMLMLISFGMYYRRREAFILDFLEQQERETQTPTR